MEISKVANARRAVAKKPSKREAFDYLKRLIDKSGDDENIHELSALYAFFMTDRVAKPKTVEGWLLKAMPKNDVRYYLNNFYHDGSKLLSTDGHRLHIAYGYQAEKGFYNEDMAAIEVDATFPDCERIIPNPVNAKFTLTDIDLDNIETRLIEARGGDYEVFVLKFGEGDTFTEIGVNKKYLKDALTFMEKPELFATDETSSIYIQDSAQDIGAVVMPIRL